MVQWLLSPAGLALLGLLVGSFLNVVIHRLPRMLERQWWGECARQLGDEESHRRIFGVAMPAQLPASARELEQRLQTLEPLDLARPDSRCPACGHRSRWCENVPVLSWLWLRGRCSACGTAIGPRYPLVELLTAALFAALGWRLGAQPLPLLWCAVAAVLVALSFIDWDTTVLPDQMTLPLAWGGLLAAAAGWTVKLPDAVAGAAAGYLSLWTVYWVFKLLTGSGAPHRPWRLVHWLERAATGKEGMGYGDFKLLAALGAWLGWQAVLPVLLAGSAVGAVVGLVMKFSGSLREGRYVPFGPFLAGGGLLVMLVGTPRVLAALGWA